MYFSTDCNLRWLDKEDNACNIILWNTWWDELIAQYGQKIIYYVNNFSLSAQDETYGEDPASIFSNPVEIVAMLNLEQSQMFARFGLMSDDFSTMLIHITAFRNVFGPTAEPKSGDIYQLSEFGNDRPSPRNGKMFEITERLDEEVTQINQLLGHYVWLIKAKRYEYSFEPGVSAEGGSAQVYDNTFFGRLSGGDNPESSTKTYPGSANDQYSPGIFDNNGRGADQDSVYGQY